MPCEHLRELFALCEKHDLHIASQDAIKVVCRQCHEQEVCPSSLTDGEQVIELPRRVQDAAVDEAIGPTDDASPSAT
ncbi:hypothetical protein [Planctomycetes bacterium TBK1r]|uniref:Uncharacterized protein n=1 Tax=Stieleria magnilauensis TaxID=2527963 RepID=A0ABX5Y150_9BACT|nr:hypothetical protein TBK1r_67930 [Planctomycetes bacterium TBK1r]